MPAFAWKKPAAAPEVLAPPEPEPVVDAAPVAPSSTDPAIEGLGESGFKIGKTPGLAFGSFGWCPGGFVRPAGKEPPPHIVVGDRVRVTGLAGKLATWPDGHDRELNGLEGVAVEYDLQQEKWRVVMDSKYDMVEQGFESKNLEKWAAVLLDAAPEMKMPTAPKKEAVDVKNSWAPTAKNSWTAAPAVEQAPPIPAASDVKPPTPAAQEPFAALQGSALKSILKNARPDWKEKDIGSVVEKLAKVSIDSGLELLVALKDRDGKAVNERLKAVGEKAFTQETLHGMSSPEALLVEATKAKVAPAKASQSQPVKTAPSQPILPTFTYNVVAPGINAYQERSTTSKIVSAKLKGGSVTAVLQSFDGWLRLPGQLGWVPKEKLGQEVLVLAGGSLPRLAVPDAAGSAGPQNFQVVFKHVAVRASPTKGALILEMKTKGTEVLADYQSFDGWVHICDYDGWMLTSDPQLGELMHHIGAEDDFNAEGAAG